MPLPLMSRAWRNVAVLFDLIGDIAKDTRDLGRAVLIKRGIVSADGYDEFHDQCSLGSRMTLPSTQIEI